MLIYIGFSQKWFHAQRFTWYKGATIFIFWINFSKSRFSLKSSDLNKVQQVSVTV